MRIRLQNYVKYVQDIFAKAVGLRGLALDFSPFCSLYSILCSEELVNLLQAFGRSEKLDKD